MAAMLASCSQSFEQPQVPVEKGGPAIAGQTPVSFGVYTNRALSRAGEPGTLANGNAPATPEHATAYMGDTGIGVFGYYTDNLDYTCQSKPNFMYNEQVTLAGGIWSYEPVKYWPNEFGDNAISADEDRVSFFAYALYVDCDPITGKVAEGEDEVGITGFSKNNAAGDPIVKYIGSFDISKSVDLCYGTVDAESNPWNTMAGVQQQLTTGLPFLDILHPAQIDQKMKFNFKHALAQLNVQIDADADIAFHRNNEDAGAEAGTKVYVRSVTFSGMAMKGALNLNNEEVDVARWLNYNGQGELTCDNAETILINDGRKNGKEGISAATEKNPYLNPDICSDEGNTTPGVLGTLQNLFKPDYSNAADPENPTAEEKAEALKKPVMVIPVDPSEPLKVTIVYDVETTDPNLASTLSDGTKGSRVRNEITKEVDFNGYGLRSGRHHTLYLHLGLNSVKFDATVEELWQGNTNGNTWLPDNAGEGNEGISNPGNMLSLTRANGNDVTDGDGATSGQFQGIKKNGNLNTMTIVSKGKNSDSSDDDSAAPDWYVENPAIALIKADNSSRRGTRSAASDEGYTATVNGAHKVTIAPVGSGTTMLHSTLDGKESTFAITVLAPTMIVENTSATVYAFASDNQAQVIKVYYEIPKGYEGEPITGPTATIETPYTTYLETPVVTAVEGEENTWQISIKAKAGAVANNGNPITVKDSDGNEKTITVNVVKPAITVNMANFALVKGKSIDNFAITGNPAFDGETYIKSVEVKKSDNNDNFEGLSYNAETGLIEAEAYDGNDDKEGKLVITYKGHSAEGDPKVEVPFTIFGNDPTAMKSDAISDNPLLKVAEYNVAANGTSFVTKHSTDKQFVFSWADAKAINITDYHVPTYDEQVKVVPSSNTTGNGANWFAGVKTTATAMGTKYQDNTTEKGFYVAPSALNNVYAVRIIDGKLTAWHYQWVSSPCNGLLIESYVLKYAADSGDSWSDEAMKKILSALPTTDVWSENEANSSPAASSETSSLVSRFLPACGNTDASVGSGTAAAYVGTFGGYWSSSANPASDSNAFRWGFRSGYLSEYQTAKEAGNSVRLFAD